METTTIKVPHPKGILYKMGRQVGLYKRGIESAFHTSGARPAAADDTAWVHPTMWGEALLAGNKPKSKEEALSYFTSWV